MKAIDFKDYIATLDDSIFIDVCKELGSNRLSHITHCLESLDPSVVDQGIALFKESLKKVLNSKIDTYKKCLASLPK